ncbi:MAG: homoserine O-succinyltransferase [Rhodospirillales bacterium]|nr:homoserine O-succinyltransferase [Rhodospirillales bacterium]
MKIPAQRNAAAPAREAIDAGTSPIVIGLVNNMPDAAFWATEGQFRMLLNAAMPPGIVWQLRCFTIPDVPRSDAVQGQIAGRYEDIGALWNTQLDGLIVTGLEPRASDLMAEPYWSSLVQLIDWALERTRSTIWSCLAAHAAVLHLDCIPRQPFPEKLFGVFDCEKSRNLKTLTGMPHRWAIPHSRHNGLAMEALIARGYRILSSSPATGADIFEKQWRSRFLFLQGHPEYDAGALLREYRRDVRRFLGGKRENYPNTPFGYFDVRDEETLRDFRRCALRNRSLDLLSHFPEISEASLADRWHEPAIRFYNDWLRHLIAARTSSSGVFVPRRLWSRASHGASARSA